MAAQGNHVGYVEHLIIQGASVALPTMEEGLTALDIAAYWSHTEIVHILLTHLQQHYAITPEEINKVYTITQKSSFSSGQYIENLLRNVMEILSGSRELTLLDDFNMPEVFPISESFGVDNPKNDSDAESTSGYSDDIAEEMSDSNSGDVTSSDNYDVMGGTES